MEGQGTPADSDTVGAGDVDVAGGVVGGVVADGDGDGDVDEGDGLAEVDDGDGVGDGDGEASCSKASAASMMAAARAGLTWPALSSWRTIALSSATATRSRA